MMTREIIPDRNTEGSTVSSINCDRSFVHFYKTQSIITGILASDGDYITQIYHCVCVQISTTTQGHYRHRACDTVNYVESYPECPQMVSAAHATQATSTPASDGSSVALSDNLGHLSPYQLQDTTQTDYK